MENILWVFGPCLLFYDYTTCWVCLFVSGLFIRLLRHTWPCDVYMPVDHSSSGDSEKSDSSWNDSMSDEEQRSKKARRCWRKEGAQMYKKPCAVKKKGQIAEPSGDGRGSRKHVTSQWESGPKSSLEKMSPQLEKDFSDKAKPLPFIPQRICWREKVKWNPQQCIWAWLQFKEWTWHRFRKNTILHRRVKI